MKERIKHKFIIKNFRMFLGGVDLNMSDYDGRTPLHLAASEGQSLMVDFFLDIAHVNPLARDRLVMKIFGVA